MSELELLDITLPNTVVWYSFSNLTWIFIFLTSIILFLAIYWFFVGRKKTKKYQIFKQINQKIKQLEYDFEAGNLSKHNLAQKVEQLLKRAVMSFFTKEEVSKFTNNQLWFEYLNSLVKNHFLNEQAKAVFLQASYDENFEFNAQNYLSSVKNYLNSLNSQIKKHKKFNSGL